jgi:hypothetical protein
MMMTMMMMTIDGVRVAGSTCDLAAVDGGRRMTSQRHEEVQKGPTCYLRKASELTLPHRLTVVRLWRCAVCLLFTLCCSAVLYSWLLFGCCDWY